MKELRVRVHFLRIRSFLENLNFCNFVKERGRTDIISFLNEMRIPKIGLKKREKGWPGMVCAPGVAHSGRGPSALTYPIETATRAHPQALRYACKSVVSGNLERKKDGGRHIQIA
eukprot:6178630-Pleurochrysis_carterae.AAC.2